jgi:hypothetical protein
MGRLANGRDYADGSPRAGEPPHRDPARRHKGRAVTDDDQDVPASWRRDNLRCCARDEPALRPGHEQTPPIVVTNPSAGLKLPVIRPRPADFLEREEADALYAAAGEI